MAVTWASLSRKAVSGEREATSEGANRESFSFPVWPREKLRKGAREKANMP